LIGQAKRLYELNEIAGSKLGKNGKIFAFASGKGGVGKTFVSLNLAMALSSGGKKILVMDLDFNLSNINVLLNSSSGNKLQTYFTNEKSLPDLVYKYNKNLHFIFGDSGVADYPEITPTALYKLFQDIKFNLPHKYDFIFLDLPPGVNKNILTTLTLVDEIVLLTSPEPTSVMDSYVVIKSLKASGLDYPVNIIVNKAGKSQGETAFQNLYQAVNHFLKFPIKFLGNISNSADVTQSIMEQRPFFEHYTASPVYGELLSIAREVNKINHVVNNSQS